MKGEVSFIEALIVHFLKTWFSNLVKIKCRIREHLFATMCLFCFRCILSQAVYISSRGPIFCSRCTPTVITPAPHIPEPEVLSGLLHSPDMCPMTPHHLQQGVHTSQMIFEDFLQLHPNSSSQALSFCCISSNNLLSVKPDHLPCAVFLVHWYLEHLWLLGICKASA